MLKKSFRPAEQVFNGMLSYAEPTFGARGLFWYEMTIYRLLACSTTLRMASAASSGRALKPPSAAFKPST